MIAPSAMEAGLDRGEAMTSETALQPLVAGVPQAVLMFNARREPPIGRRIHAGIKVLTQAAEKLAGVRFVERHGEILVQCAEESDQTHGIGSIGR